MYAYLWTDTAPVSDHYHDGGGLLIIAYDIEAARALWLSGEVEKQFPTDSDDREAATENLPARVWQVPSGTTPEVFTFPDSGCC